MRELKLSLPFIGSRHEPVGANATVGLTGLGKTKAEQFSTQGPKFDVIGYLDENGPSSLSEIAEAPNVRMSISKVKRIVASLIASGYVQKVGANQP